jgi:DNA polymerase-3 subunit alpha
MGQTHLFDQLAEDDSTSAVRYPDAEEWSDFQQLTYEKEVLGLFITGHPLAKYSDRLSSLATTDSSGLSALKDDTAVVVGGIVSKIKSFVPKRKQERMAFVTIEDMDGMFETVVFSDLYSRTADLLSEDAFVMIAGRVNYRDSEPKIVAEEIVPLDKAEEKFAKTCHIKLATTGLEESAIARLAKVVSENEGRCKLFIHCTAPGADDVIIESSIVKGLNPTSKAREQIEKLAGEGSVMFSSRAEAVPAPR